MNIKLIPTGKVISTILKHDAKITSYKIALLRAINDVALSFSHLANHDKDVAIPLRMLAEFWVAYYWPFVEQSNPIAQGPRAKLGEKIRNDMAFRPLLTSLRLQWENDLKIVSRPSDGFFIINELRIPRRRDSYSNELLNIYKHTLTSISNTLEMPIRYAGPGNWTVFAKPTKYSSLYETVVPIPGTRSIDKCLVIRAALWQTFYELSLWIEALCIHEWCLFTENVEQESSESTDRGDIYRLLTDRPDNRRPLTWERNNVDLLLIEGNEFVCPWTETRICKGVNYDMDHLIPVSVYPINELWNLVPADPYFNSYVKRNYLPSSERLQQASSYLEFAYKQYGLSKRLSLALREDVAIRFSTVQYNDVSFPHEVAGAVVNLIERVAESRNITRF